MSRIARPGIGAVPSSKPTQTKVDDDDRLGSKTIKNQLTKSSKRKDRESRNEAADEEHLKTVVTFSKRGRVNFDDSDDDSEDESRTSALSKTKSQSTVKKDDSKMNSMLDDIFGKIGIDTDEIRRQEQELEAKRQKNRENREKKKLRKKQQQDDTTPVTLASETPATQKLSLHAIGGAVATTTRDLVDESDEDTPTTVSKATKETVNKVVVASDSSDSDEEDAKPAAKPSAKLTSELAAKAPAAKPSAAAASAKVKIGQFQRRNYDESDSDSDSDSEEVSRPVAKGDVLGKSTLVADSDSDSSSEDEEEPVKKPVKIVDAVIPLVNKNKNAAGKADTPREPGQQRAFHKKGQDGKTDGEGKEKKPFVKKEGTGSFRFVHLAPEERPTHDANGKRIKYRPDGRIRNSKRSKQKNIKKDTRPAHLRPGYTGPAVE